MKPTSRAGHPTGPHEPTGPAPSRPGPSAGSSDQLWFLARLLERTTQPFALVDFEGRFVRVNLAFAELTGFDLDELLAMRLDDVTPDSSRSASVEPLARLRATGRAERYEKVYRRKDGRTVPVEVTAELYRDAEEVAFGYFTFVADITERKRAERALVESEERFRHLYDEAPVGYHEIDARGTILNINRTECELLGYRREEMIGRPIFDFVDEPEREASRLAVGEKMAGRRSLSHGERTYRTRDGRRLVLAIEDRLVLDDLGQIIGVRSAVQDITERKRTEAALVASERRARALFEGIDDAIFVHDPVGRLLDANPAACRALGYSREELLRLTTHEIDAPEFAEGYEDRVREQFRRGRLTFEGMHRTKSGRLVPVEISSSTIQFEGRPAILSVIRDISERKALEEARRQLDEARWQGAREVEAKNRELTHSEARYRQLTEGCLDAVVVADDRGRVTLFNPSAERTFGCPAADVIGRPLGSLMPKGFCGVDEDNFHACLEAHEPRLLGRTVELRGLRPAGEEFPLELSLNAVEVGGRVQYIGSIRDQTERQRMRDMLVQSEKLASIGLLSAGVAHEINNPLAYIANNLAVLERDMKGVRAMIGAYEGAHDRLAEAVPEVLRQVEELSEECDWPYLRENLDRMLARTRDGVHRVATIVQNLRSLARTSSTKKMEEVLVGELLNSALEMVQGRLRRRSVQVDLEVAPESRWTCVASEISQVLLNLVVNAIQAIEAADRAEGNRLRIAFLDGADEQAVEVADSGPGIPADDLPHLFDPFFTTKPIGEGTGLGLAISHGIVSNHGGRIEVESRPGEGACFRVVLPRKPS